MPFVCVSGERKSPYIAVCCVAMALSILFFSWPWAKVICWYEGPMQFFCERMFNSVDYSVLVPTVACRVIRPMPPPPHSVCAKFKNGWKSASMWYNSNEQVLGLDLVLKLYSLCSERLWYYAHAWPCWQFVIISVSHQVEGRRDGVDMSNPTFARRCSWAVAPTP